MFSIIIVICSIATYSDLMDDINELFTALAKSRFRSQFKLSYTDRRYFQDKGIDTIITHARQFIEQRLSAANPKNDGRQTPFKGHPVFTAQHATATCCRGCLAKWHKIPKGRALSEDQIEYIITIIKRWLEIQMSNAKGV